MEWRALLMLALGFILACRTPPQPPPVRSEGEFQVLRDKGALAFDQGRTADAMTLLEAAHRTARGAGDPEVSLLLAALVLGECQVERAVKLFAKASTLGETSPYLDLLPRVEASLGKFGALRLLGQGQTKVDIEPLAPIVDPEKRACFERVRADLMTVTLPCRVHLPAGRYRVRGKELMLVPGGEAVVE